MSRLVPARVTDGIVLLAVTGFCAVLLRRTLLSGGAMLGYDLYTYFFPAKTFAAAALWGGTLPLWNPYLFFGAPFLANVQMAVLYPPDLLFAVLSFPRAVAVSQWLHLVLAGAGMYALGRWGWGLDAVGGAIGALAFAGGGFFGAHMGHLNQVHAAAWLPWIALAVLRLAASLGTAPLPDGRRGRGPHASIRDLIQRGLPWLVAGGVAVALQLTAGHTQEAYYSLFAVGLLAAAYTVAPPARAPRRWTHLPAFGGIALNGALLAGAQLLPAAELSRLSYRQGGVPLPDAVALGVERMYILESLLPTFTSLPSQEVTGYVGVTALALAVVALAVSGARRTVLALSGLTLLALTLAMGAYTPLYALFYDWVPGFASFRAPGRWLLISTFTLAGLAAHGATALRWGRSGAEREQLARRYSVALTAAVGLLVFFIWRTNEVRAVQWLPHARVVVLWGTLALGGVVLGLWSIFSRLGWARTAIAGGLALELVAAAREMEYNRPGDPELYLQSPAIAGYLAARTTRKDTGDRATGLSDRVLSIAVEERLDGARLRQVAPREDGDHRRYAAMREALKPSLGMAYGLPTIDGYDGGLLPTRDYARFKSLLVTGETPVPHYTLPAQLDGRADRELLGTLNVRYVLTDGRNGAPGAGWELHPRAPGAAWLYENTEAQPRATLVHRTVPAAPAEAATLSALGAIDLRREALVGPAVDALAPPQLGPLLDHAGTSPPALDGSAPTRRVEIVRYSPQELELETESDAAALLVVWDSYYPGWRATVDGFPAPVLPANVVFRGVPLPAGAHRVRLWFDPLSVKLGFAVSAIAILANAGGALLAARFVRMSHRPAGVAPKARSARPGTRPADEKMRGHASA
ncbi:MAG: YfhO family protein [Chloroflexota bacterium]|nr:YfhO family protein [Chloroflexota bacterium]